MHSNFSQDILASADLGQDTYEGPHEDRESVSVSCILRIGEGVTVLMDVPVAGLMEIPLPVAKQLAEALTTLLAELDD